MHLDMKLMSNKIEDDKYMLRKLISMVTYDNQHGPRDTEAKDIPLVSSLSP